MFDRRLVPSRLPVHLLGYTLTSEQLKLTFIAAQWYPILDTSDRPTILLVAWIALASLTARG